MEVGGSRSGAVSSQKRFSKKLKKVVDEKNEVLHNLVSLLLTNKTICRKLQEGEKPLRRESGVWMQRQGKEDL